MLDGIYEVLGKNGISCLACYQKTAWLAKEKTLHFYCARETNTSSPDRKVTRQCN